METLTRIFIVICVSVLILSSAATSCEYILDEGGIHIKPRFHLFKYDIVYLRFKLIDSIYIVPSWKFIPLVLIPRISYGSTFGRRELLVLKYKTRIIPYIILTPDNPRGFVESIKDKLPQKTVIKHPWPRLTSGSS